MPKKTLALVSGLVIVTFVLFVIALKSSNKVPPPPPPPPPMSDQANGINNMQEDPSKKSVLTFNPNPVILSPSQQGRVTVNLENLGNEVTAVQLEIAYDPNIISNVKVSPGGIFTTPVVLINKNSVKEGRYTYAFGIMPNQTPVTGSGDAAYITFTTLNKTGEVSQLALLPETLVTARGISNSVLKSAKGTLIEIK